MWKSEEVGATTPNGKVVAVPCWIDRVAYSSKNEGSEVYNVNIVDKDDFGAESVLETTQL